MPLACHTYSLYSVPKARRYKTMDKLSLQNIKQNKNGKKIPSWRGNEVSVYDYFFSLRELLIDLKNSPCLTQSLFYITCTALSHLPSHPSAPNPPPPFPPSTADHRAQSDWGPPASSTCHFSQNHHPPANHLVT